MIQSYSHSEKGLLGYHLRKVREPGRGEAAKVTVGDKLEGGCVSPRER